MAWLTVREAANILQISEAAVRKRAHRDTLRHMKGSDGRLYIYMDDNRALGESTGTTEVPETSGGFRTLIKGANISAVLGSLAGIATLIYILGLFSIWAPIWRTYTHDVETAWHAVSVVPRTLVIGFGVKQLIALPLLVTIGVLSSALVLVRIFSARFYFYAFGVTLANFWVIIILLYLGGRISAELSPVLEAPVWALALLTLTLFLSLYWYGAALVTSLYAIYKFLRSKLKRKLDENSEVSESDEDSEVCESDGDAGSAWTVVGKVVGTALGWVVVIVVWSLPALITGLLWMLIVGPTFPSEELRRVIDVAFLVDAGAHVIAAIVVLCGGLISAFLVYLATEKNEDKRQDAARYLNIADVTVVPRKVIFFYSLGAVFLSAFLAAVTLTLIMKPPLPPVVVKGVDGHTKVEGELLTHVDAHWYVFNQSGNLVAFPDREVRNAEICSPDTAKTTDICQ